jgi:hypothetical protein
MNFLKNFRASLADTEETPETTNLHLTHDEFKQNMLKEVNGQALLDLLESGEWRICERMGLIITHSEEENKCIVVPGWKNLVAHLSIVNSI